MTQSEEQNNLEQANPNTSQSRLASLVGFEEEVTQEQEQMLSASSDLRQEQKDTISISSSDVEPSTALDPRDASSFRPVWARPGNKAYVVLAGTSVVALLLYGISNTLFNTPLRQAQTPSDRLQEFPSPEETQNPIGTLKVETALGDQAAAIAKLNEKKQLSNHNKATPARPVSQKVPVATRTVPQRVVAPVARPPAPRFVREPSRSIYPLARQYPRATSLTPVPVIAQRPSTPPQVQVPETPKDPMERWLAASQMGSYSSSSNSKERPTQVAQDEQIASDSLPSQETPVEYASLITSNSSRPTLEEQTGSDEYQAQEYPILQEKLRQFIRAGTTAKATLATSLAWDESEKSLEDGGVVIVLDEPIIAADGAVIVPEGSQLIAKVQSLYDSGLVRLVAVAAIKDQDGERVEIDIPQAAIVVRGVEGNPLIAKQLKSDRSRSFGSDVGRVLLGAARNGTSILNRPRQSSSFSSGGYSSSSQTNDPDFLAGAFEGASETLLDNLEQRNQRSSRQTSRRSSVWVLKANTKVEVFVSKSVPLDLPIEEPHQLLEEQEHNSLPQSQSQLRDRAMPFNLESTDSSSYYLNPEQDFDLPSR